ncbi:MAG: hypothetical protein CFH38_00999 [Alphaproteobacteria bacterium MarineAlpha10_Bin1]|jgi:cytoskeletal protein CcmA (bactofilin family)|nr:MAG: hypothetical protein CFH38_00999 [Alphaproteobacteria bacterium MarineAlpha10_Bin1]
MFFTSDKRATAPETQAPVGLAAEGVQINKVLPGPTSPLSEEGRGQRAVEEVMRARGQFQTTHLTRFTQNGDALGMQFEAGSITVGNGVRIEGSIVSFRTLEVLGFLKGELVGENLTIGGSGMLEGSVRVEALEVIGCFKGEAKVNGHLIVRATGKVAGTLSYRTIEIDNGGIVQGSLDTCPVGKPDQIEDPARPAVGENPQDDSNDGFQDDSRAASDGREFITFAHGPTGGEDKNDA